MGGSVRGAAAAIDGGVRAGSCWVCSHASCSSTFGPARNKQARAADTSAVGPSITLLRVVLVPPR